MTPSGWHDDARNRDAGHDEMQSRCSIGDPHMKDMLGGLIYPYRGTLRSPYRHILRVASHSMCAEHSSVG